MKRITKGTTNPLQSEIDHDFTDRARKPDPVGADECRYYVDDERQALANQQAEYLRQQRQDEIDPKAYVSSSCNDPNAKCKKQVKFSQEGKVCRHYVPTGQCLTCCP